MYLTRDLWSTVEHVFFVHKHFCFTILQSVCFTKFHFIFLLVLSWLPMLLGWFWWCLNHCIANELLPSATPPLAARTEARELAFGGQEQCRRRNIRTGNQAGAFMNDEQKMMVDGGSDWKDDDVVGNDERWVAKEIWLGSERQRAIAEDREEREKS